MSDQQQLAVREATAIVQSGGFDDATVELIRRTVSDPRNPLTSDEFSLFMAVCKHLGANPLLREAHALKDRTGRFSVAIGIDKFRQQTQADPRFLGQVGPFWCGPDGQWKDVWLDDKTPPAAAKVGIWLRGGKEPTWGVATYKAYARQSPQWQQNPAHMLAIRAEAHAHRKCSSRLSGPVVLRDDEGEERPPYVDADGVIDEQVRPALEAPGSRARVIADGFDAAPAEADAAAAGSDPELDAVDRLVEEINAEAGTAEQPPLIDDEQRITSALWPDVQALAAKLDAAGINYQMPPARQTEDVHREWISRLTRALRAKPQPAARR